MTEKIAVYPGAFDPITNGHFDIIKRGAKQVDKLYVVLSENTTKRYLFTLDERLSLTKEALSELSNVEVVISNGLTVEVAKQLQATTILRGLRNTTDFDYEYTIARSNQKLDHEIETIFLLSRGEYAHITSSVVKEIAKFSGDVTEFVPQGVKEKLQAKFGN